MKACLRAGERASVVGHHQDQGVRELSLPFQLGDDEADEVVEARHLVRMRGEIGPGGSVVAEERRHAQLRRIIDRYGDGIRAFAAVYRDPDYQQYLADYQARTGRTPG